MKHTLPWARRAWLALALPLVLAACGDHASVAGPTTELLLDVAGEYDMRLVPASAFELPAATVTAHDAATPTSVVELVTNGGFETNDGNTNFAGWLEVNDGSGNWFVQSGTQSPPVAFPVPAPPGGTFAAMTGQGGPGRHILWQDVTLAGGCDATLRFDLFIGNRSGLGFSTPNNLSLGNPNQQFRMDVVSPGAPIDDVDGVLLNVYRTEVGDPNIAGYFPVTADLSAFTGQTVRLRFAEIDNRGFFNAGVDNVSLQIIADDEGPDIDMVVSPTNLWPPNHEMVQVASGVSATAACGVASLEVAVSSNEAVNSRGDGNTDSDWTVVDNGDGTFDVWVRAERSGRGDGRIYTITATAVDVLGNVSQASVEVTVAHDRRN